MVYIGGYSPIKMLEELLNLLMRKGVITKAEADEVVAKSAAPKPKE